MKTLCPLLLLLLLASSGCLHVPPGGASEVAASFGVPSVFGVEKEMEEIKVTEKTIRAGTSTTDVNIFLFYWNSRAKDVVLSNPAEKP